jgi:glycolate oxidase iron-sulfur subunit
MNEKDIEEKLSWLDEKLSSCVSCGLCSEDCATFQLSGYEHESPRGRLHLAAQFLHGRIDPGSASLSTFDRCLGCRACEPLCPHQVPYRGVRQIVQDLRRELGSSTSLPAMERALYKRWITVAYRIGKAFWRQYGAKWLTTPSLECRSPGSFAAKRKGRLTGEGVLAVCCVQDLFQHEVIEQTLQLMQRLGHPLEMDKKQPCCGAIFERLIHGGEETVCYSQEQQRAVALQRKTLNSFLKWLPQKTYFLAKGCESFIARHSDRVEDLYVWIESILDQKQLTLYFPDPKEVYYQPYCDAKKEGEDPIWRLLHRIEGLTVRAISYPWTCCGGYCGETVLHPAHAEALARKKMDSLPDQAILIVTSPDCWGLFKRNQAKKGLTVFYPMQLLADAMIYTS